MTNFQSPHQMGDIYGALLIRLDTPAEFKPLEFPFQDPHVSRGNHIKPHSPVQLMKFDYWHGGSEQERLQVVVPERSLSVESRMVGHHAEQVLRDTVHRIITVNNDTPREDRKNYLDTMAEAVLPSIQTPALISAVIDSLQPKFLILSRDIPVNISVFVDAAAMLLFWTNEKDLDRLMRLHYGERFYVYRMQPLVNTVVAFHTSYLKRRIKSWSKTMNDNLKIMNALEAMINRRSKGEPEV